MLNRQIPGLADNHRFISNVTNDGLHQERLPRHFNVARSSQNFSLPPAAPSTAAFPFF